MKSSTCGTFSSTYGTFHRLIYQSNFGYEYRWFSLMELKVPPMEPKFYQWTPKFHRWNRKFHQSEVPPVESQVPPMEPEVPPMEPDFIRFILWNLIYFAEKSLQNTPNDQNRTEPREIAFKELPEICSRKFHLWNFSAQNVTFWSKVRNNALTMLAEIVFWEVPQVELCIFEVEMCSNNKNIALIIALINIQ